MEALVAQFTEEENLAKAQVKVGDEVCAWVRLNGETLKIRAVVTLRHENGTIRIRYKQGHSFKMTECKTWRAFTQEEKTRLKIA